MVTYRLPFYNIILQLYKCFPSSFGYRIHKIPQRIKAAGVPFPTAFMLCFFYALLLLYFAASVVFRFFPPFSGSSKIFLFFPAHVLIFVPVGTKCLFDLKPEVHK